MRFLFLQNIWREYFGVMHVGAALRAAGHEVEVRIAPDARRALSAVATLQPDVVGFSFTNCEQQYVLNAAATIKRVAPHITILAGGAHPSLHPELARREGIDIVCRGEGDAAIVDLADRLQRGVSYRDVRNLAFVVVGETVVNPARPLLEELDRLPLPWRAGYYRYKFLRDNPVKFFFTSRGCPFSCNFCFNSALRELAPNRKKYVRHFSPEWVLADLTAVRDRWPMKIVRFEDDVFTLDRDWLERLLTQYTRRIGLPYICYVRAGIDEETIRLLASTGCRTVLFGIETGDEKRRNGMLKKGVSNEQILATAALLHKHRLHFFTTNILALPHETWDDALTTLRLNQQIRVPDTWCSVFQPYAGLPLTERAVAEGLLPRVDDDTVGTNTFAANALLNPDAERIFNLHKFFYPLARWPRLEKYLLPLTKRRPNRLFHYLWLVFYVYSYRQHTDVSWRRIVVEGMHWFRQFLSTMGPKR